MLLPIFSVPGLAKKSKEPVRPEAGGAQPGTASTQTATVSVTPPGKVRTRRVARRESISTPSITNALRGKVPEGNNRKTEPQKQQVVPEVQMQPFSREQLVKAWKEFVVRVEAPQLNAALSTREPSLEGEWNVQYMLDNETQRERLVYEVKPRLLGFLRRTLRNEKIEIEFQIAEGEDALPRKPYSDSEKWQAMVEENPSLALFKKMFGLDFDN